MKRSNQKIRQLTQMALLIAIILVMWQTPLGYLRTPVLSLSFLTVPVAVGAVVISFVMSRLFRRFYTGTYCVIFGIFLAMIPNMLSESCVPGWDGKTVLSFLLMLLGFGLSFYLGDPEGNNARLGRIFRKRV